MKKIACFLQGFVSLLGMVCFVLLVQDVSAQNKITVSGIVLDSIGSPIAGVSIVATQNKNITTITDVNGRYIIDVAPGTELQFSYVGHKAQSVIVDKAANDLNIVLEAEGADLGEVVVTAFGRKQRREAVVGSVESVNAKDLKVPSSNLTTAFAGRMSGVISYQQSGEPGADNAMFFVRGVTSFGNGSGNPLILIDNIELTTTDLARLQPDDIESFSILKDASATALYGARGANGVIFVTTKQGKEGKAKFNIRLENSMSQPVKEVKLADPVTYMELYSEAQRTRNPLDKIIYQQNQIDATKSGDANPYVYPATNWQNILFKDQTFNQRANVNLSGGGKIATYYISGSYNLDNGILKVDPRNNFNSNVKLHSYQLRTNLDIKVTPTTNLSFRMFGIFDDYKGPIDGGGAVYMKSLRASPSRFAPYYEPDEARQTAHHILFGNYREGNNFFMNPYSELLRGYKEYSRSRMLAQFELSQDLSKITEGLNFRALFSTNRYAYFDVNRAYSPYYYNVSVYNKLQDTYNLTWLNDPVAATGSSGLDGRDVPHEDIRGMPDFDRNANTNLYGQAALDYSRAFGESHNLSGTLIYQVLQNLATTNNLNVQYSLPQRNLGLSGRASYNFQNKYFAEFNFGYNGSERFYKDKQFGFFPTIGAGWMISKEKFWQPLDAAINKFKIRGSYGLVGNDAIGNIDDRFFYLSSVNLDDNARRAEFGFDNSYNRNGVSVYRYPNFNITWEKSYQTNIAAEIGLFNQLDIVVEYYRQERKNILMSRASIPTTMGLDGEIPLANVGEAKSQGVDLTVQYNAQFGKHIWVTARGTMTFAHAVFKKYEEPEYKDTYLSRVGQPISQQWGLIAERLFIDDKDVANAPRQNFGLYQAGDIKYKDVNGDGQITTLDRVPLGFPTMPEVTYGFGGSAGYKNFDLSLFFQGNTRVSFWIDPAASGPFVNYDDPDAPINRGFIAENALIKEFSESYWSEENQDIYAVWPRLSTAPINNNTQVSSWFMRDGSFLRLKSFEFGYTFPKTFLDKYNLTTLRIYLSGSNIFTYSKFRMWDPEMGGRGLGYPVQKVYNVGININF